MQAELIADKEDYSDALDWTSAGVSEGDVVIYNQAYWRAKADTLTAPSIGENWELAPKFATECINEIWCNLLGPYLSWLVIKKTVPTTTVFFTGNGMVTKFGEGFNAADESSVKRYQVNVDVTIEMYYKLLITKLETTTCLTYERTCLKCGCGMTSCRCNKRHHTYEIG